MYRSMVGKLLCLTLTWPDIVYSVNVASKYMTNPIEDNFLVLKRILRYRKGTLDMGWGY